MSNPPFFHEASGAVHFWVPIDGHFIGASIGKETLHYCYGSTAIDDQPMENFQLNAHEIAAAGRRRVSGGSVEPVMLRGYDLHESGGKGIE